MIFLKVLLNFLLKGDTTLHTSVGESGVCWIQFISRHTPAEINMWSQEALLPVSGVACDLRFARINE
jgi:hypothetical protein